MKILLGKYKNFYKANLHCHSTNSDGRFTVEQLKENYKNCGYSIVAFTDHEHLIDNSHLNDQNFLAITSAELAIKEFPTVSTLKNHSMKVAHFNIYALDPKNTLTPCYSSVYDHYISDEIRHLIRFDCEYERAHTIEGINDLIKKCKEQGFLVAYNHPTWSLENATDYNFYENLDFIEVYNHSCCIHGRPDDEHVFDDIMRTGKKICCTCADDNHNGGLSHVNDDSFGGWVNINADKLDYSAIIDALKNGDFYASTGPEIYSLTKDGDKVTIKTSASKQIRLTTFGRRSDVLNATDGNLVSQATFKLNELDKWFRITVVDASGKKAYTQAYDTEL